MKSAHDYVTEQHIVLDISAGQAAYKAFFSHGTYVALDSTSGDKRWDFSKLDIIGDAMHLPIRAACIDVALNFTSLEHYAEPGKFFAEVSRVLMPGGKLFLFAPHLHPEHQQPYDFHRYTQYALRDYCTRNGSLVEAIVPVCSMFFTTTRVLEFFKAGSEILGGPLNANNAIVDYIEQTMTNLTSIANQFEAALERDPQAYSQIPHMPMQYTLRASKPGESKAQPRPVDRQAMLNAILADPFEKKPMRRDGVSEEIVAELSNRRYPIRNGVSHFMS